MKKFISVLVISSLFLHWVTPVIAQTGSTRKSTIAIIDFKNTSGKSDFDYLEKAIPEALITRLAESGKLNMVERARLQDALNEMQLGMTGVVDQRAAVEIGKAVGANAIMVGSFLEIGGMIQLNARLIDVETSKVLIAKVVKGRVGTEIFNLMDELAVSIEQKLVGKEKAVEKPEEKPQQPPVVQTPPARQPTYPQEKKGGSKAGLYILGGLLIGGGIAAAVLLGGGGDGEKEPTTATITINVPLDGGGN